jgi:hypothetical protein
MKKKDLAEMLTATEVARLWNERAAKEGIETNYTRWSVYGQKDKLDVLETPLGPLFNREQAMTVPLPRYRKRPDTTKRNRALKGKKRDKATGRFLDQPEEEPDPVSK